MTPDQIMKMWRIRAHRNQRLAETDGQIFQCVERGILPDAKLVTYRQALRDMPVIVEPLIEATKTQKALEAFEPDWPTLEE